MWSDAYLDVTISQMLALAFQRVTLIKDLRNTFWNPIRFWFEVPDKYKAIDFQTVPHFDRNFCSIRFYKLCGKYKLY